MRHSGTLRTTNSKLRIEMLLIRGTAKRGKDTFLEEWSEPTCKRQE